MFKMLIDDNSPDLFLHTRSVRIFLSSTFKDFAEERELLIKQVFPELRRRLQGRFVELIEVDLRWGITAEQADKGEVLPICLTEVDRARPFFVGMLGERYGWIPEKHQFPGGILDSHTWLEPHKGERSVTEFEILHGVLNNPNMAGRAFFYFRSAGYAAAKGGDYLPESENHRQKQIDLKQRIKNSEFTVVEDYPSPQVFAEQLRDDLWRELDAAFPADSNFDIFDMESLRHESYARPRRGFYFGGESYLYELAGLMANDAQWVMVEGESGSGKSALIANYIERHAKTHPTTIIFGHFVAATSEAAECESLARRWLEFIRRTIGSTESLPSDRKELYISVTQWLSSANHWAEQNNRDFLFVFDALDGLNPSQLTLDWLPTQLPPRLRILVSCLPGDIHDEIKAKAAWKTVTVKPLSPSEGEQLILSYLQQYSKNLGGLEQRIIAHPLVRSPLFLRSLVEELRLFGSHEQLENRLNQCLTSQTIPELFERIIDRVAKDNGRAYVRTALEAIWVSRKGLSETEILGITGLKPLEWAAIRLALGEVLRESSGYLIFAHAYIREAVKNKYLSSVDNVNEARLSLGEWFEIQPITARSAEEIPFQWQEAEEWERLRQSLTHQPIVTELLQVKSGSYHLLLLSYWLAVETHLGVNAAEQYQVSWNRWFGKDGKPESGFVNQLQIFLQNAGRYGEFTLFLARLCNELIEAEFGPDHPDTATSLNNLALLLLDKGDYEAAESLYRRALAIHEAKLGPDHPDTAISLNNLAGLLDSKGDYEGAEPLFRRALAINEAKLGFEHPDTATSLNNLAFLLHAKGDYDGAESLYRRALAICEAKLGFEHPDTAGSLNNLAKLLDSKGDYEGAEPLYRRALEINEAKLGFEHPDTATSLNNLALLLQAKGDYEGAEPLYRRALAIREAKLGFEHPDTATSLNNLAGLLKSKRDYDGAESLYRRALAIYEAKLGPDHPDTALSLNNLAVLLYEKGDYDGAEPLCRRALEIRETKLGPDHPSTATSLVNLAGLLHRTGRSGEALPMLERALTIFQKTLGDEHPDTQRCLGWRDDVRDSLGK